MGDDVEVRSQVDPPRLLPRVSATVAFWWLIGLIAGLLVVVIALLVRVTELTDEVRSLPHHVDTSDSYTAGIAKDTEGLCRLVGALAETQDIQISDLFDGGTLNGCEQYALEGAATSRP